MTGKLQKGLCGHRVQGLGDTKYRRLEWTQRGTRSSSKDWGRTGAMRTGAAQ